MTVMFSVQANVMRYEQIKAHVHSDEASTKFIRKYLEIYLCVEIIQTHII